MESPDCGARRRYWIGNHYAAVHSVCKGAGVATEVCVTQMDVFALKGRDFQSRRKLFAVNWALAAEGMLEARFVIFTTHYSRAI